MDFELIISNPPYGAIGANITKNIIDTVNFTEFINLLPANDYKRNITKDLFNYQSDMKAINDGFTGDAAVTTHIAKIHKNKVNTMTLDEFERSNYIDRQLDKYFAENTMRDATFKVDYKPDLNWFKTCDSMTSIYINKRDVANEHLAYSKDCNAYLWNTDSTTAEYILSNSAKSEQANGHAGDFTLVKFSSATEKINITKFIYSKNGFRFISKVMKALNADSYISPEKYLPKVDWTRSWLVEEILTDYGYTETEIQEVMNDLNNFKYLKETKNEPSGALKEE